MVATYLILLDTFFWNKRIYVRFKNKQKSSENPSKLSNWAEKKRENRANPSMEMT